MENLDEKIDLMLERSMEEIVTRLGGLTVQQALDADDVKKMFKGDKELSNLVSELDGIDGLEQSEKQDVLNALQEDLEAAGVQIKEQTEKAISLSKTAEAVNKIVNPKAREMVAQQIAKVLKEKELTPDKQEDIDILMPSDKPDIRAGDIEMRKADTRNTQGRFLDNPDEWDEWHVGYVVLDKRQNNKKIKQVNVGGPFSYAEAVEKVEGIFNAPEQEIFAHIYTPFVSLENVKGTYMQVRTHPLWRKGTEGLQKESLLREDKLNKIVIDLEELKKQTINESWIAMFGGWVQHVLDAMFGNYYIPMEIRGSKSEVESFARTIGGEKKYIETARRYGLDHPTTYKSKAKLDVAVKNFEKDTGLKWPFK